MIKPLRTVWEVQVEKMDLTVARNYLTLRTHHHVCVVPVLGVRTRFLSQIHPARYTKPFTFAKSWKRVVLSPTSITKQALKPKP